MKTMTNLLQNEYLIETLKEILELFNSSSKKLSFQPAASYWELNPAERLAGMVKK